MTRALKTFLKSQPVQFDTYARPPVRLGLHSFWWWKSRWQEEQCPWFFKAKDQEKVWVFRYQFDVNLPIKWHVFVAAKVGVSLDHAACLQESGGPLQNWGNGLKIEIQIDIKTRGGGGKNLSVNLTLSVQWVGMDGFPKKFQYWGLTL